ncbi:MAG: N-acetyl-gamma-glutamyl-phosphate reductase [Clostridiales bacterium]|jgi:N-acetyl-gamma-glutamyl-phosphate reductase|nr:N-acetyl-gamma-glutamyl-phosphate reductase [Clostridiales bacterium]
MTKPKVFIDGHEGTTGLKIYSRLEKRPDLELVTIDRAKRKDIDERQRLMDMSDLVILCLPDKAAIEAACLPTNPNTRIIDASTAHRTAPGWIYGFPELGREQRNAIAEAKRVANPGCHATGIIALVRPLISAGILPSDYPLSITSLTGYSGGGKSIIAQYEDSSRPDALEAPRLYGLGMAHKHIREIVAISGLSLPPAFSPVICDHYSGMEIIIPLHRRLLKGGKGEILDALKSFYEGSIFIGVSDAPPEDGYLEANAFTDTNRMELIVTGSEDIIQLVARFDNLGKGASGAAVQNMNIMLGLPEDTGLI